MTANEELHLSAPLRGAAGERQRVMKPEQQQ
jgi:hypothetical protein